MADSYRKAIIYCDSAATYFTIFRMQQTKIISTVQTNIFYVITDKYPLECVFVYNFVPPNLNLFLPQACWIFV